MDTIINEINERLTEVMSSLKDGNVKEAMTYSLMAGGKRLRPLLFCYTLKSYGVDYHDYIDVACAIEMIHTYSLIHDDLPGMDNDDLRRGRPTCHIQFDEATAILAGDGLLNESMNVILNMDIDSSLKVDMMKVLYDHSGVNGMIYGQQQDIYFEDHQANLKELEDVHHYKTGCLLSAPLILAGLIANKNEVPALKDLGFTFGLAFQIQDDILDVTSDTETLGKPVGSDIDNHKSTYVTLLGVEQSQDYANKLFKSCLEKIYALTLNHGLMIEIIEKVMKRVK